MLFVIDSALDRKAEFLARHAECKAGLMRRALEYDEQGFPEIAEELRCQTAEFSIEPQLGRVSSARVWPIAVIEYIERLLRLETKAYNRGWFAANSNPR